MNIDESRKKLSQFNWEFSQLAMRTGSLSLEMAGACSNGSNGGQTLATARRCFKKLRKLAEPIMKSFGDLAQDIDFLNKARERKSLPKVEFASCAFPSLDLKASNFEQASTQFFQTARKLNEMARDVGAKIRRIIDFKPQHPSASSPAAS
jgi:hypothetical protein